MRPYTEGIPEPVVLPGQTVEVNNRRIRSRDPWEPGKVESIHWHDWSGGGGGKWWTYTVIIKRPRSTVRIQAHDADVRQPEGAIT